ncbi:MAG: Na+/H+ antiporter NhaC [Enterocloster asparagiformis]|nr:Na+/H+ antiporter NhaC [Enterocloster asparagiformis]
MSVNSEHKTPSTGYALLVLGGVLLIVLGANKLINAPIQPMFLVAWLLVYPACMHLGYTFKEVDNGAMESIKKGMGAVLTIMAVGALIATWIAAGTVPAIIYYGMKMISPKIFLVASFLLCGLVSLACGTSWGTLGTAGIAMFAIGESIGVSSAVTVGAIVSGAYLGDMLSPMSDSTNVASASVGTDLITHCKELVIIALPVIAITTIIYYVMGMRFASETFDSSFVDSVMAALGNEFRVGFVAFIPVILLLVLIFLKKPAMLSMIVSALVACAVAVFYQGMDANNCMTVFWNGFKADTGEAFLDTLLNRGGVTSMASTAFMMIFAFGMIGAFNTVGIMEAIIHPISKKTKNIFQLTLVSEIIALIGNTMGTNTFSLLMTGSLMAPAYKEYGLHPTNLSKAINATSTPGCTFIPWNASGIYVVGMFGVGTLGFAPYACLVYLMPIAVLVSVVLKFRVVPASVNLEGGEKYSRKMKQ